MTPRPPRSTLFPTRRSSDLSPLSLSTSTPSKFTSPVAVSSRLSTARPNVDLPHPDSDRKSTRLNSSHVAISYAVFSLKKQINHKFVRHVCLLQPNYVISTKY